MKKISTFPNLAETSSTHQAALAAGTEHFHAWSQNVIDDMKGQAPEEIKEYLASTAHDFAVCFEHWIGDFNLGTGIRNANAFNAKDVFYIGDKRWDRRSAVGVNHYTEVKWIPTVDELLALKKKYTFIGVDNVPGSVPMRHFVWPKNSLMIFGEEGAGLTPEIQKHCQSIVYIEMFGSVRSLNCGTASGIAMYDYIAKNR